MYGEVVIDFDCGRCCGFEIRERADDLNVNLKTVYLGDEYIEMLKHPKHGIGAGFNPCVDCRTMMFDAAKKHIEERLLSAYTRLRNNAKNGLAVVQVMRGSCGGCFNKIPPQRQLDIVTKKKILVCEHCGRILVPAVEE